MSTDPLLRQLQDQTWPELLLDAPTPCSGELWRASWASVADPVACTVVVTADAAGRMVEVAPVDHDPIGDENSLNVSATNGMELVVWVGPRRRVYKFAMERRLAVLDADDQARLRRAIDGEQPGDWPPITSDLDDRTLVRAHLVDRLESLAAADWLPIVTRGRTLREIAEQKRLDPSVLARHLDVTPGDARRLLRGERLPDPRELELLTDLLVEEPGVAISFDEEMVAELDEPVRLRFARIRALWARVTTRSS